MPLSKGPSRKAPRRRPLAPPHDAVLVAAPCRVRSYRTAELLALPELLSVLAPLGYAPSDALQEVASLCERLACLVGGQRDAAQQAALEQSVRELVVLLRERREVTQIDRSNCGRHVAVGCPAGGGRAAGREGVPQAAAVNRAPLSRRLDTPGPRNADG